MSPWKTLDRIGRFNIILGAFIWSRVVFEVIGIHSRPSRFSQFFALMLIIDLAMGLLSLLSGMLLRRRHPGALLFSAVSGGAIYVNALFGMLLSFPTFFSMLPGVFRHATMTGSLASHFVQSAVLSLYWTAVLMIVLGDLKKGRLEEIYEARSRPAVLTCFATAASTMSAAQILLRLFTG